MHSLYYWWRDQGLAEQGTATAELSPCYLNRMDATEIALGWGKSSLELLRGLVNRFSSSFGRTLHTLDFLNCMAPPGREYRFPRDLYV